MEEVKEVVHHVRRALADDLDTPRALEVIDQWADKALQDGAPDEEASSLLRTALNSSLGVRL